MAVAGYIARQIITTKIKFWQINSSILKLKFTAYHNI